MKKILRILGIKSKAERTWDKLENKERPYVFKPENHNSWGDSMNINEEGNLHGSFISSPKMQDGDLLIYESISGMALAKITNIEYYRDPSDMIKNGEIFPIGLIDNNGSLTMKQHDFVKLTEVEQGALEHFLATGRQKYVPKFFL